MSRRPTLVLLALLCIATLFAAPGAGAQLLGEPAIPSKAPNPARKGKQAREDVEWMWQYSPPPVDGRQNDLIQDPHFLPFLARNLTAPQSFWGPDPTDPRSPIHKSLAQTAYDFLAIPGKVLADQNRYITVTGSVFHFPTSRGLLFVDLNDPHPLIVFAAIEWIRDARPVNDPAAPYTLWIFPNRSLGSASNPDALPTPLEHALTRWMSETVPATHTVENVTAAVVVEPDGTPHQIAVPRATPVQTTDQPQIPRRTH